MFLFCYLGGFLWVDTDLNFPEMNNVWGKKIWGLNVCYWRSIVFGGLHRTYQLQLKPSFGKFHTEIHRKAKYTLQIIIAKIILSFSFLTSSQFPCCLVSEISCFALAQQMLHLKYGLLVQQFILARYIFKCGLSAKEDLQTQHLIESFFPS